MSALTQNAVTLSLRVVFAGDRDAEQETRDTSWIELRGLLLHRLTVLEAALQRVAELRRAAVDAPTP
jgi:hypothetical protein